MAFVSLSPAILDLDNKDIRIKIKVADRLSLRALWKSIKDFIGSHYYPESMDNISNCS